MPGKLTKEFTIDRSPLLPSNGINLSTVSSLSMKMTSTTQVRIASVMRMYFGINVGKICGPDL
jgi:hypothetical protein